MAYNELSNHATTINGQSVTYHETVIVQWDDKVITLNTGGYFTNTTKKKMNQASNQFDLGYNVYQKGKTWFVDYKGMTLPFRNNVLLLAR